MARRSIFLRELPCNKLSESERPFARQKVALNINPHAPVHYVVLPLSPSDVSGSDETTKHRQALNKGLGRQGLKRRGSLNPVFVDFPAVDDDELDDDDTMFRDIAAQRRVEASIDDDAAWGQSQASSSSASSASTLYSPPTSANVKSSVCLPALSF